MINVYGFLIILLYFFDLEIFEIYSLRLRFVDWRRNIIIFLVFDQLEDARIIRIQGRFVWIGGKKGNIFGKTITI